MEKNEKFDAVQFMRNVREKLSERYWKHPEILQKDMEAIRDKYDLEVRAPEDQVNLKASLANTASVK